MRKRFEIQYELGATPIEEIEFPRKSRDELPPVLLALQYIYKTPSLNRAVFEILESKVKVGKNGRPGMSLWEILVLGVVRLTLDANYDRLEHIANYDRLVRDMLGITFEYGHEGKSYNLQTLKDNVGLLDEEMLMEINEIVVKAGQKLVKKKEEKAEVKVDTYVLESNVHFPTDISLLFDSARKCLDIMGDIKLPGWRKYKDWKKRIKNEYIKVSKISAGGGKNKEERLFDAVYKYLQLAITLSKKIEQSKDEIGTYDLSLGKLNKFKELKYFKKMLDRHIDLVKRRIIYGEKVPHSEKLFSIFETYTEWVNKGKSGGRIELGLKIAVCSDQYDFILFYSVLQKKNDVEIAIPITEELLRLYNINSISFDKGFWSKDNYEKLSCRIPFVIMPKKGRLNKEEYEREHTRKFKNLRRSHSAIESDINSLEHHGLNRCPDRGIDHFKKYVGLGVLSYNLHRLGNILTEKNRKILKRQKRLKLTAA